FRENFPSVDPPRKSGLPWLSHPEARDEQSMRHRFREERGHHRGQPVFVDNDDIIGFQNGPHACPDDPNRPHTSETSLLPIISPRISSTSVEAVAASTSNSSTRAATRSALDVGICKV